MSLDSIFDRELVEQTEGEIVILKYKDNQKEILRIIITEPGALQRVVKRFSNWNPSQDFNTLPSSFVLSDWSVHVMFNCIE